VIFEFKVHILVDAGIADRKTGAVYLGELETVGILRSKKSGKETRSLNLKPCRHLSK
jgi:hypothetical protein